jgi:hypothetical protein
VEAYLTILKKIGDRLEILVTDTAYDFDEGLKIGIGE